MPDFQERYDFVLSWLQRRHAYVAASIMRLGRVRITEDVSTAAIVARGKDVWLYFNPQFLDQIDNAELAGVLTHEALHFVLQHQQRMTAIKAQRDRFYFQLACEAVINDLILASFKEMKLPGEPVTGQWLVAQDTSRLAAEQVMQLLMRARAEDSDRLDHRLAAAQPIDDHSVWEVDDDNDRSGPPDTVTTPAVGTPLIAGEWTTETTDLVKSILDQIPSTDPFYGTIASGASRPAPPARRCRKNLEQFLEDMVSAEGGYDTLWTKPNRKLYAFYPQLILPVYELRHRWDILMAIDSSGSVPSEFLSVALAFAGQRRPDTRITLISFDTAWYEANAQEGTLQGGGGTRAQAVEEFIQQKMRSYPDIVFLLTDGWTPAPTPERPARWVWLLPPWGSTQSMPKASVAEFFEAEEMSGHTQLVK